MTRDTGDHRAIHELRPTDWRGFRQPDLPSESWLVADGTLIAQLTRSPVDLITRERFGDFDLTLEWCVPAGGNSGVLYRVSEGGAAFRRLRIDR